VRPNVALGHSPLVEHRDADDDRQKHDGHTHEALTHAAPAQGGVQGVRGRVHGDATAVCEVDGLDERGLRAVTRRRIGFAQSVAEVPAGRVGRLAAPATRAVR